VKPDPCSGLRDVPFVCSWSGGKDSCLALHLAVRAGGVPRRLLCVADETGRQTRSHRLPVEVIRAQAAALGLPLTLCSAPWETYEEVFIAALGEVAAEGVTAAVFGDIDIEEHRAWEQKACRAAGVQAFLPLWGLSRGDVLDELFALPVAATVVTAEARVLDGHLVGRRLTPGLAGELERAGWDVAGELGEYHTAVTDCPLFAQPLALRVTGSQRIDDHWFARLVVGHDAKETG